MGALERSAALFGNEKMTLVLIHVKEFDGLATAQNIASSAGLNHSLVGKVLRRLEAAGVLRTLPRSSSRGELYFQVADPVLFDLVGRMC